MAEAEGTVSKHMEGGKGHYLTKVESRAKGILIHRRPILAERRVKRPTDLECYYSAQSIIHQARARKGRTIEINTTINGRLRTEGVGDVKKLERRKKIRQGN